MATATSPPPTAITSRISPKTSAPRSRRSACPISTASDTAPARPTVAAAKLMPARFSRLFVMEPTVMDPRAARAGRIERLRDRRGARRVAAPGRVRKCGNRFQRFRAAPAFAEWTGASLGPIYGTVSPLQEDGRVRLRCTPEIESAILRPISRRWSKSIPVMRAAIRSPGYPRSIARYGWPPPRNPGRYIKRWRHGPWR